MDWTATVAGTAARQARDRELLGRETPPRIHAALVGWILEVIRTAGTPTPFLTMGAIEEVADGTGEPAIELDFFGRRWRIRVTEVES